MLRWAGYLGYLPWRVNNLDNPRKLSSVANFYWKSFGPLFLDVIHKCQLTPRLLFIARWRVVADVRRLGTMSCLPHHLSSRTFSYELKFLLLKHRSVRKKKCLHAKFLLRWRRLCLPIQLLARPNCFISVKKYPHSHSHSHLHTHTACQYDQR